MLIITDAAAMSRALNSSLCPKVRTLLSSRCAELVTDTESKYELDELANWIIVAPGDALSAIEKAAGFPIAPDPPWEWVLDHDGIMEAPIIVSDDGFGIVLVVPNENGIDPTLLTLLRRDAVAANRPGGSDRTKHRNPA